MIDRGSSPPPTSIRLLKLGIALVSLGVVALAVASQLVPDLATLGLFPSVSFVLIATLATRLVLWLRYRPTPPVPDAELPRLTVIIPAYNEGRGVIATIASVLASSYPHERLHVIAVNDGSKDDTGPALDAALADTAMHGGRLTVLHLPVNRGKRGALYEGFKHAIADQSTVVATIDSDSVVEPETLRHLVAPFADPAVGGVAGKVLVLNRTTNVLTRMLHVRYLLGFDFVRAYQSVLDTVWCCPGAIQAYRLGPITPHLEAWNEQRFLGVHCTNGDDHAMTNLVLSLGFATRYQATAVCWTLVPTTTRRLCKMYIRWGRSAAREGFRALRFVPRRLLRLGPLKGPLMAWDAVSQPFAVIARTASIPVSTWLLLTHPLWLLRALLAGTLFALFYALVYLRSEKSSDVLFGVLYGWYALFVLFWVQPFATVTVRRNGWLTRG